MMKGKSPLNYPKHHIGLSRQHSQLCARAACLSPAHARECPHRARCAQLIREFYQSHALPFCGCFQSARMARDTLPLRGQRERSAIKVTIATMLTKNMSVYSIKVMAALTFTAQGPNSSSLNPLPPLPPVTHCIRRRYIAETTATVSTTNRCKFNCKESLLFLRMLKHCTLFCKAM